MTPQRVLMVFTIMNRGGAETMVMNYYRRMDRGKLQFDFLVHLPDFSPELYTHKKMKTNPENSLEALQLVVPVFEGMTDWSYDAVHDALIHLAEEQGLKNGRIMWPVRVAVSGKPTTPGGAVELCQILGKEETLRRIQQGIQQLTPQA